MDSALLAALKLAREGYGTPEAILQMPADIVLAAIEHSNFIADYESTAVELNKEQNK